MKTRRAWYSKHGPFAFQECRFTFMPSVSFRIPRTSATHRHYFGIFFKFNSRKKINFLINSLSAREKSFSSIDDEISLLAELEGDEIHFASVRNVPSEKSSHVFRKIFYFHILPIFCVTSSPSIKDSRADSLVYWNPENSRVRDS